MIRRSVWLTGLTLLAGCTSNPTAPVNQVWPIPQMDRATGYPHPQDRGRPEASDYTQRPGYLPAYPPYDNYRPYPPGTSPPPGDQPGTPYSPGDQPGTSYAPNQ